MQATLKIIGVLIVSYLIGVTVWSTIGLVVTLLR